MKSFLTHICPRIFIPVTKYHLLEILLIKIKLFFWNLKSSVMNLKFSCLALIIEKEKVASWTKPDSNLYFLMWQKHGTTDWLLMMVQLTEWSYSTIDCYLLAGTSIARQSTVEAIVSNISLTWHLMTTSRLIKESRLTTAFAKKSVLIFISTSSEVTHCSLAWLMWKKLKLAFKKSLETRHCPCAWSD